MHLYWRGKQALPEHTVVTNTKLMTTIFLSNAKHWSLAPLLFFSLTFTWSPSISVFLSPTSWPHLPCLFLRSVTPHLKKKNTCTFYPHILASLLVTHHLPVLPPPAYSSMTAHALAAPTIWHKLPLHSSSAATGALWSRKEGLDGVRADGGKGLQRALTAWHCKHQADQRVSWVAAHWPSVTWHTTAHMAKHERGRDVCECCVWMTSHVAYGGRWLQWRLNKRGVVMAACSISFVVRGKGRFLLTAAAHASIPLFISSSSLSKRCLLLFYSFTWWWTDQNAPTILRQ